MHRVSRLAWLGPGAPIDDRDAARRRHAMHLSTPLKAKLDALSTALSDPGVDLQAILELLVDDLSGSVPSFVGLTMTQQVDGSTVTINAFDANLIHRTCSSLALPLALGASDDADGTVVFFAAEAGAFVQLTAGFELVNGRDPRVVLDGPLPNPMPISGVGGLSEMSAVNRAIGVLITRGYSPLEARAELRRRASDGPLGVPDVARQVLMSTTVPHGRSAGAPELSPPTSPALRPTDQRRPPREHPEPRPD